MQFWLRIFWLRAILTWPFVHRVPPPPPSVKDDAYVMITGKLFHSADGAFEL